MKNLSKFISASFATVSTVALPMLFASPALANAPALYFYYDYLNISKSQCQNLGYDALEARSLNVPSRVKRSGSAVFAIGTNDRVNDIVDCSEIARSRRITVMAASSDPRNKDLADTYAKNILNDIKSRVRRRY